MFNQLYSQPFYNMLISPLDEIENQVLSGNIDRELLIQVFALKEKLDIDDWRPFPAYQNLLDRLQIRERVMNLVLGIKSIIENQNIEIHKRIVLASIKTLKPRAQLLNLLEVIFNDPNQTKINIIVNFGKQLGFFGQVPQVAYDCNDNLTFIDKKDSQEHKIPATSAYGVFIGCLNAFTDLRMKSICNSLFSTMDEIEINGPLANNLKAGEQNLFKLGYIENMITVSNLYKQQFKLLLEELNNPNSNEEDAEQADSSVLCNLISDGLKRTFGK